MVCDTQYSPYPVLPVKIEQLLERFKKVYPNGPGSYKALCPCHKDREPSLCIGAGDQAGKIVLHCFAGCTTADILEKVGLRMEDLFDSGSPAIRSHKEELSKSTKQLRNTCYSLLLQECPVELASHRNSLRARGLVDITGYGVLTLEGSRRAVAGLIHAVGSDRLISVPGFIKDTMGQIRTVRTDGLLIPVRCSTGEIVALQVRTEDENGKYKWFSSKEESSGSVCHVPLGSLTNLKGEGLGTRGVVRITEGPLKADVCMALQPEVPTIGVPGVSAWKTALPVLGLYGAEKVSVRLAFDADWQEKPAVKLQLHQCYQALTALGYEVDIETWYLDDAKGIDDLLLKGELPKLMDASGAGVKPTLEEEFPDYADIILVNGGTIKPKAIEWLWKGWLPYGAFSTLDGDPGEGKSTLVCSICAWCTAGISLPRLADTYIRGPKPVLLMAAEDSRETTWIPRLFNAKANVSLVEFWDGNRDESFHRYMPQLPKDIRKLEYLIRSRGIGLVVIDPLFSYIDARYDSFKSQHMQVVLNGLSDLADRTGACILGIRHLNKASTIKDLYRGSGSVSIVGVARSGLMIVRDEEDEDLRYLGQVKYSLTKPQNPLKFRLSETGITWEGEEIRSLKELSKGDKNPATSAGVQLLTNLLNEAHVPAQTIYTAAEVAGISKRSLERCKKLLGIVSYQQDNQWYWRFPHVKSE